MDDPQPARSRYGRRRRRQKRCECIAVIAPATITDTRRPRQPDHTALRPRRWKGGLPACRDATRTASLPATTLQLPNRPDDRGAGEAVPYTQAAASRRGSHRRRQTHQSRPNGRVICDDLSSVLTVSQFLRGLILHLIISQNVKMWGPTPNTPPALANWVLQDGRFSIPNFSES
jgi:hypothetical protein